MKVKLSLAEKALVEKIKSLKADYNTSRKDVSTVKSDTNAIMINYVREHGITPQRVVAVLSDLLNIDFREQVKKGGLLSSPVYKTLGLPEILRGFLPSDIKDKLSNITNFDMYIINEFAKLSDPSGQTQFYMKNYGEFSVVSNMFSPSAPSFPQTPMPNNNISFFSGSNQPQGQTNYGYGQTAPQSSMQSILQAKIEGQRILDAERDRQLMEKKRRMAEEEVFNQHDIMQQQVSGQRDLEHLKLEHENLARLREHTLNMEKVKGQQKQMEQTLTGVYLNKHGFLKNDQVSLSQQKEQANEVDQQLQEGWRNVM